MLHGRHLAKYLSALLLFGLNGIVASNIEMSSYEIVFLRTMIGSALLIALFLLGRGKLHVRRNPRDALFITLSGVAIGDNVIIGANSVVNRDVPSNSVVAGVPIRHIRNIDDDTE